MQSECLSPLVFQTKLFHDASECSWKRFWKLAQMSSDLIQVRPCASLIDAKQVVENFRRCSEDFAFETHQQPLTIPFKLNFARRPVGMLRGDLRGYFRTFSFGEAERLFQAFFWSHLLQLGNPLRRHHVDVLRVNRRHPLVLQPQ